MRLHLCDAFMIFYGMDKTSMSNSTKNRLNKKGFTLAEVLVTVAIILILAGVTFVSVVQYQKNLRLMEMDGTAKEIFIAAQNHLSVAQASGDLDRLVEKAKSATGTTDSTIGTKLSSAPSYADNASGEYYYVIHNVTSGIESYTPTEGKRILEMMLPFGALDETVATGGNYAIVYELKSASVVAVLYSGAGNASFGNAAVINFGDDDVKAIPTLYNDKSARKNYVKNGVTAIVGCYTGKAGSAAIPTETLEAPKLEVKNENKLHVLVRGNYSAKDVITLTIHGVQSNTTAIMQLNCTDNGSNEFDITLDDITSDSTRFTNILSSGRFTRSNETPGTAFIPGENIEISATARATDALATPKTSAVYTTSSLFADVNDGRTVYIQNMRHLENLSVDMSDFAGNLTDKSGTTNGDITAIQKNDITMLSWDGLTSAHSLYGAGTLKDTYVAVNVNYPLSYDGGRHEIYGLSIAPYLNSSDQATHNAGIFGNVTATLSVKNLILRNDKIPVHASGGKALSTAAGMLLGKTSANLTVDGVLAYYHETEYNEANDSAVEVQASQVAGGLIGLVAGGRLEVKNSAAAVYVKGGSAAGGLIGSADGAADGSTIVQSYAGGHTRDGAYDTKVEGSAPKNQGAGRYNVQASGYAGGFIGMTTDKVSMNAVYSTASAYASSGAANAGSFAGKGTLNIQKTADGKENYYAIGPHNGTDASADETAKAQLVAGQTRRQATAYDRTLMGITASAAHPAMDKTSYPLNTIRHLLADGADDKDLPWFIKEHVGDWVVSKKTEESNFEVENGNRLTVRINTGLDQIAEDLYYEVKVHGQTKGNYAYFLLHIKTDGTVDVQRRFNTEGFQVYNHNIATIKQDATPKKVELYLDDITKPYGNFASVFDGNYFYPGEDISINVTVLTSNNDTGAVYDEDKKLYTNSLYGYLQNASVDSSAHNRQKIEAVKKYVSTAGTEENGLGLIKTGDQYYVQIDNSRHLQNLSENVGYSWPQDIGSKIAGVIQTDNIYWAGSSVGRAYTIGFQEELGADLSVYSKDNQLTQNGLFCPIATYNTLLSLYDGSGYRISGLAAVKNADKTAVALFVQPKGEMTIKNLTLENVDFYITGSEARAAGLIGYADHPVTIDNVHFVGALRVKGSDITGGFVPQVNSNVTITNSSIENANISSSDNSAAGLIAYVRGVATVDNVNFTGNVRINGEKETACFVAHPFNNITITNSGIEGDTTVISDTSEAGGLIGYVNEHDTTVKNAKVVGKNTEVIAGKNAGGLIGNIGSCPTLNISNVGVSAFVASNSKEDQAGAGGLIGRIGEVGADSKIEKSYYGGRTTEGIYDRCTINEGTEYENTYDANVNGEKFTGGFIGYIGKASDLLIDQCFSTGSVKGESEAAGGFIGSSLAWCQGSMSIKSCYSMGKVSGTSSSKGGFIGKSNGTITFENVFYYSAFNSFEDTVGNQPGSNGITVINYQKDILADDDSRTVNTQVYDMSILEGETYPYKNWTTEHDDTSMTMVPTYYGDWPKVPERQLKGYLAYYELYENGSIGIYMPGVKNTLMSPLPAGIDLGGQKTGYGVFIDTRNPEEADDFCSRFCKKGTIPLDKITNKVSDAITDYSISLNGETFYFWKFTSSSLRELQPQKTMETPWVTITVKDAKYHVNANYGAAIAPEKLLGTPAYPFRIRNKNHSKNLDHNLNSLKSNLGRDNYSISRDWSQKKTMDTTNFPLFSEVKADHDVTTYIGEQNKSMKALHFTEHSFAHVGVVCERTAYILEKLGFDEHTVDLALTAAWMHDLGNIVNRVDHSQSGALMAFSILNRMNVAAEDIAPIICAIGNHDEGNGQPVSAIAAALILADKSDVRRSRVQEPDEHKFDIHDRVNYSVTDSKLKINKEQSAIKLKLSIDTHYGEIGEYFEIFMERMLLCKKAANFLGMDFHLIINEQTLL